MESWIDILPDLLPVDEVHAFLAEDDGGGINIFIGTTRRVTGDRRTKLLSYEAHKSMALKEIELLIDRAKLNWPLLRVVVLHRIGDVPVAEASVIVGVATSHRSEAFAATRFLIDELKKTVQIWKRETFEDGSTEWQGETWID
jgi:molybdopterin synthase catalytic subunit